LTSQDVILGILMKKNLSGYDIKHMFESLFSYFFDASYGTIYPTLGKMEHNGLITKESVQQEGKPNKNVYTITEKGRLRFHQYLESDVQESVLRSDLMVRLFFGELADNALIVRWMEQMLLTTESKQTRLLADYENYKPHLSPTQDICINVGIRTNALQIELLTEGLERIRQDEDQSQGEK
jgi:DNA-binding PadR family transcriptional regulator